MAKTEQTDCLIKLLKPDIIIDLGKTVVTPLDLLWMQTQLDRLSGVSAIETIVDQVIAAYAGPVEDYRNGKKKALSFLTRQVMKATKGKANPQLVNQLLREKLD